MKSIILLLIFCLLFIRNSCAQSYTPLVQDSATWVIKFDDLSSTPFVDSFYGYRLLGDTLISGVTYKKLYRLNFSAIYMAGVPQWAPPFLVSSTYLVALLREASKKIYAISTNAPNRCNQSSEYLLYDFNYAVNTPINLCLQFDTPDVVNSVMGSTAYPGHRELITGRGFSYYEGIGTQMGLLESVYTNLSGGLFPSLYSYCTGALTACHLTTNIWEPNPDSRFLNIYPNPATNILKIDLPKDSYPIFVTISNNLGQIVLENFHLSDRGIDVSSFPDGLYHLVIKGTEFNIQYNIIINH